MAAPWAVRFYRSRAWREARQAYGDSKHWLCERCGGPGNIIHHNIVWLTASNINDAHITLGRWNLQCVCDDCHNKAHHRTVGATRDGFAFDDEGNLIPIGGQA